MTDGWRVISRHTFRRTADHRRRELERLQREAKACLKVGSSQGMAELAEPGITASAEIRTSPKRWRGYWRVEVAR